MRSIKEGDFTVDETVATIDGKERHHDAEVAGAERTGRSARS